MPGLDAALPGVLTDAEAAAAISGPGAISVRANLGPARPAVTRQPNPEPAAPPADDGRPLAALEAEEEAAREVVDGLREKQLRAADRLEEADRRIEQGRQALDPGQTAADRAERSRLSDELAEYAVLIERASARQEAASALVTASRTRQVAAAIEARLAALQERAAASDLAINAAIEALLDLEDQRWELVAEAERAQADMDGLPVAYRTRRGPTTNVGGVMVPLPGSVPAGIRFDRSRVPALGVPPARPRRYLLGGL